MMNWMNAKPVEIERRLELCRIGTDKIRQASDLTRAAMECREQNWVRAHRLERYADRLRKRAYKMIAGEEA